MAITDNDATLIHKKTQQRGLLFLQASVIRSVTAQHRRRKETKWKKRIKAHIKNSIYRTRLSVFREKIRAQKISQEEDVGVHLLPLMTWT